MVSCHAVESALHLPNLEGTMSIYYQDDNVTLYHGSALDIAPTLSADMVLVDPPYGDTPLSWDMWPAGWIEALPDVQSIWCFGSMRMLLAHAHEFTDDGWKYAQEIVWEKHNGSGFSKDRFRRVHEFAIHYYKGQWRDVYKETQYTYDAKKRAVSRAAKAAAHNSAIGTSEYISEDGGPRLMRSVLQVRGMHRKGVHPTQKPVDILTPLIRYSCPPGGTVLDVFAGSGSTLVAATQEGRKAIGIEIDERYCEAAAERLSQGSLVLG